jgi:hypothetical protein
MTGLFFPLRSQTDALHFAKPSAIEKECFFENNLINTPLLGRHADLRDKPTLLPETALFYSGENTTPLTYITCYYDENNRLKLELYKGLKSDWVTKVVYNRTFVRDDRDMTDTITRYNDSLCTKPLTRTYYNYHYYDVLPVDSFYMEEIKQQWDAANWKWVNQMKEYIGYHDTLCFDVNRLKQYIPFEDTAWLLVWGYRDSVIYDNQGRVKTSIFLESYSPNEVYNPWMKREFYLDDDGVIFKYDRYVINEETYDWKYTYTSDILWKEWNGYGGMVDMIYFVSERKPLNKRGKKAYWDAHIDTIYGPIDKYYWDFDDYGSHIDTGWYSIDGTKENTYLGVMIGHFYDQYGNYTASIGHGWDPNGTQRRVTSRAWDFRYADYGEGRIGLKSETDWWIEWNPETLKYDSVRSYKIEVIKYVGFTGIDEHASMVNTPLVVSPNPAQDAATVTASVAIRQLDLYDLTGRRIITQQCRGNTTVNLSLSAVPAGFYLLKATLQNGTVQNGKLVVR